MPTVPVPQYDRVNTGNPGVSTTGLPAPRMSPDAPVEAFGGGQNLEAAVKPAADAVSSIVSHEIDKANQLAVLDAENKLAAVHTDLQYGKDGAMNKTGKQVFGLYDDVKEKWTKASSEIASNLSNDAQRRAFSKIQSNYWQSLDANVQRHSANEIKQFDTQTTDSALKNTQVMAGQNWPDAKFVGDSIGKQHAILVDYADRMGMDQEWVAQHSREAASETHIEVIKSMLVADQNTAAKAYFGKVRGQIDPAKAEVVSAAIDAKAIYDTVQKVSAVAQTMRTPDGQIDRTKIDGYVASLKLSPEDTYKVQTHVDHLVSVDNTQLVQQRTVAERSFVNELIQAQASGITYDQALKIPAKYGWDNASMASMQDEVTKIYASPSEKFNTWIAKEPQDVQGAWAETVNSVKAKYGNTTGEVGGVQQKLAEAALTELKQDVLGKNADQIRDITAKKMERVAIKPGSIFGNFWPDHGPAWQADANTRQALSEAYSLLEKDYGADNVGQARSWLAVNSKAITPANVKKLLDSRPRK